MSARYGSNRSRNLERIQASVDIRCEKRGGSSPFVFHVNGQFPVHLIDLLFLVLTSKGFGSTEILSEEIGHTAATLMEEDMR